MTYKYQNKIGIYLFYILIVFLCTGMPQHLCAKEQRHILLLSSYFPDKENSNIITRSFLQELKGMLDCRITVEHLDSESSTDFLKWEQWMLQMFEAYTTPPDAVVIIGSEGWSTYSAVCPPEWKNIPVILGFMKTGFIDYARQRTQNIESIRELRPTRETFSDFRVTGYYVRDYFRENLELIRRLQPEIRHISYVYDNRYGFRFLTPFLEKIAAETGFESLSTFYGNKLTTAQLAEALISQDSSSAILSSGWYTDSRNYAHAYSMLHNLLSLSGSKYFYLIMDQGTANQNYLGGYFVAAQDIGHDLAALTHDVLTKGIENSPEFQITPSEPHYYLNYTALKDLNIKESSLPADVVLYNKEPSFLKTYFWQILALGSLFLALIAFFIVWINHYRQVAAKKTRMAREQELLREKSDESNRLKSAFLANMSHEIRTPLNAIVGFSRQLADTEDKEEMQEFIDIIETNNVLLLQLINDILDMSKIEAGQLDFVYSPTEIVEVCRTLKQVYLPRVREGVELICDVPDEKFMLRTDCNRLTQVISNFLSNAIKFTESGHIRFGYEHIEGGLRFFTEDTGKGISPENLPRVFIRFEKLNKFVAGNGLGMSISKSIVEKMGGQIGVESQEGKGTTFWFTLPTDK